MPPVTLLIKPVSNLCNMRCQYCFYADVSRHRETESYGVMSLETLESMVKKALYYAEGICAFGFQGGEPTLAGIDFFRTLISFQKRYVKKGVRIINSIQTNGFNLNEEWALFLSHNDFLVGLSIDGTKSVHDKLRKSIDNSSTYDSALATAKMFQKHDVQYNILSVVNSETASMPRETYASLKAHKFLQFIPCLNNFDGVPGSYSLSADDYARFLKLTFDEYYKDFTRGEYVSIRNFDNYISVIMGSQPEQCGMSGICGQYFLIEADGSVFPCDFYVLDEWKLGNINTESFARIAKSGKAQEFIEVSKQVHPDCMACKWKMLCRGGCRRYREPITSSPSLNIYCTSHKSLFKYAYDRMIKMCNKLMSGVH